MAIQIHQLNELTSPSMSDYLAEDTGSDTGKVSVSALAAAIVKDYEATFGSGDTASIIDEIDTKVSKAGDTMTGNLVLTGENVQRLFRINNGIRNIRFTENTDGNAGFYDDGNSKWLLRFGSNGAITIVVGDHSYTFNSSGVLATYNGSTLVGAFPNVRVGTYVYNGTSTQTFTFTPSGTPAATNFNRIIAMAQDAGNIANASLDTRTGVITVRTVSAVTVCRVNYLLFHD